jgi:hypothetical protein
LALRYIYDNRLKPAVFLYDLATGEHKQIFDASRFNVARILWTRDGKGFYTASQFTSHPQYVHALITGGSADTAADVQQQARQPAAVYIGFRVVKD